jgi:hypothetical protein
MHMKRGFTLIEVLLSLMLQVLILSVLVTISTNLLRVFKQLYAQMHLQQQVLQASYLLRDEISHAGYWGCRSFDRAAITLHSPQHVTIVRAHRYGAHLVAMPNQHTLVVPSRRINRHHRWMISDCFSQQEFLIKRVRAGKGQLRLITEHALGHHYLKQSYLAPIVTTQFYTRQQLGYFQLFFKYNHEPPQLLIDKLTAFSMLRTAEDSRLLQIRFRTALGENTIVVQQRN